VQAKLRVPQPKFASGSLSERARRSCLSRNYQRQLLSRWRVRDPCERFVGFRDEEPLPGAWFVHGTTTKAAGCWLLAVEPLARLPFLGASHARRACSQWRFAICDAPHDTAVADGLDKQTDRQTGSIGMHCSVDLVLHVHIANQARASPWTSSPPIC
jgi:hypothetical protein